MLVNGVLVNINGFCDMTEKEISMYVDLVEQNNKEKLKSLTISNAGNGEVDLDYTFVPQKFQRIRRITGYLVGTVDRFNNAKCQEEADRVKHGIN